MADDLQLQELKNSLNTLAVQQQQLMAQQESMLKQLTESIGRESSGRTKKDFWEKIGAIAPILSGTIIAIGGTIFTISFNQQQLKLQEAQTIERFIPHLLGDEKSKRAAILAISSLTEPKLAAKVAAIFASPGTVSALESIAENDTSPDRKALKGTLVRALDNMAERYRMDKQYEDAIATYKKAVDLQVQQAGASSPELVPNLNRIAELCTIYKDYPQAENALKRAADIEKTSVGPDSVRYAAQLRRLAALYKDEGFDSKAQSTLSQAIAIEQKTPATASGAAVVVAPDHPEKDIEPALGGPAAASSSGAPAVSPDKARSPESLEVRVLPPASEAASKSTSESAAKQTIQRTLPGESGSQDSVKAPESRELEPLRGADSAESHGLEASSEKQH